MVRGLLARSESHDELAFRRVKTYASGRKTTSFVRTPAKSVVSEVGQRVNRHGFSAQSSSACSHVCPASSHPGGQDSSPAKRNRPGQDENPAPAATKAGG